MSISAFARTAFAAAGPGGGHGPVQAQRYSAVNSGASPTASSALGTANAESSWARSNGVESIVMAVVWAMCCSPGTAPGCLGTKANPVHLFDDQGKEVRSFGAACLVWRHGIPCRRERQRLGRPTRARPAPDERAEVPGGTEGALSSSSVLKARC